MTERSNRPEIRNPVLALPEVAELLALPPESRAALRTLLVALSSNCAGKAQHCWRQNKAPMALYWKVVSVYAKHIAHAIGPRR